MLWNVEHILIKYLYKNDDEHCYVTLSTIYSI